jgi:hypothetical protein
MITAAKYSQGVLKQKNQNKQKKIEKIKKVVVEEKQLKKKLNLN